MIIPLLSQSVYSQGNSSFMDPPKVVPFAEYEPSHKIENRKFSGISSLAIDEKNGEFWTVWYAGISPHEDEHNYVVLSSSADKGETWKETLVIDPDGEGMVRAFDPEVWVDPLGKVWVFWAQAVDKDAKIGGVWAIIGEKSENGGTKWSAPRRLTDGVMMCKPFVLNNGDWVLPASTWRETDNSAKMVVSSDKGKTWVVRGGVHVPKEFRNYDEHHFIEKKDGKLWALVRTTYGIGESYSSDSGKTWSDLKETSFEHPAARFFIRRLQSGNLLLVKHGPISVKTKRSHLMAFISKDDGKTWSKGLLLDERINVSYPDGQQTADGSIYITYDRNRTIDQQVLMTHFTEEDVFNEAYDEQMVKIYNNRRIISTKQD
ncbi:hypothetical protein CQA01_34530 [Cyclobacterium qasimii]|nr:hypothetical protein CQA01_34530 [Cyclobacterium qasimii]